MICYVMTCSARTLTAKIRRHNTEKYLFFEEIKTLRRLDSGSYDNQYTRSVA